MNVQRIWTGGGAPVLFYARNYFMYL